MTTFPLAQFRSFASITLAIAIQLSFATPAGATTYEAETMPSNGFGTPFQDGFAFWSNSSIEQSINVTTSGLHRLTIIAYGNPGGGQNPLMQVSVNGNVIDTIAVSATSYQPYPLQTDLAAGSHRLRIAFTNDYYNPGESEDRNLYVDRLDVTAVTPTPDAPRYGSDGSGSPQGGACDMVLSGDLNRGIRQAAANDRICIAAGDYRREGVIEINDNSRIVRASGPVRVRGIAVDANDVTIDGFQIADGQNTGSDLKAAIDIRSPTRFTPLLSRRILSSSMKFRRVQRDWTPATVARTWLTMLTLI